jgi:hypothetical protein
MPIMPTIKTKPVCTPKHLSHSVHYLDDADHPAHQTCTLGSITILNGTPVSSFVAAVETTIRVYNQTVDPRNQITSLATEYFFNFAAGSDLSDMEKETYARCMVDIICWDRFAAQCWHDRDRGAADYNLIVPNVLWGALAPRKLRQENLMGILRQVSDQIIDSLNGKRASEGKPLIPTVAMARNRKVTAEIRSKSFDAQAAQAARQYSIHKVEVKHLPTIMTALGLGEGVDWEIDFLMRLRIWRRSRKDKPMKRAIIIPIKAIIDSVNTFLGHFMPQKNEQKHTTNPKHANDKYKQQYNENKDSQHKLDNGRSPT